MSKERTNIQVVCMIDDRLYVLKAPRDKGLTECMNDIFSVLFDVNDDIYAEENKQQCKYTQYDTAMPSLNHETPSATRYE